MSHLKQLIALQKKEGWTNLEVATILEIPVNTWETWRSGRRKPKGPAKTLIKLTMLALQGKPITRQQLLAETGRTGGLTAETMKELNSEEIQ